MKHIKLGITIAVLAIVAVIIIIRAHTKNAAHEAQLPATAVTQVSPQAPLPESTYNLTTPLSKNRITYKDNMKIEVTTEGTGDAIKNGQIAVVTYVGTLPNGSIFDASKNHGDGSFSFQLGAGQVIKGWDEGVLGMKVGESRALTIPPELAYGPNGMPPVIPPNATLAFAVTLLAIK